MRRFFKFLGFLFIVFLVLSLIGGIYRLFSDQGIDNIREANIAVLEVEGVISNSMPVLEQLEEFRKNSNLKALIVRINSPGGAVGASQEIYMELKKLRDKTPVIVSMGDIAASGGLYVSLGGATVFALPGTLTGSMGVLLQLTQINRLLEKIYVDPITLKSGEMKDAGNPTSPMQPQQKKYLQELILKNFEAFKRAVVTERKLSPEAIAYLSDGRVVDGEKALELKLVDRLGTFQDAVDYAKEQAKISGELKLSFLSRKPKGFFEKIVHEMVSPIHSLVKSEGSVLQYRWDPLVK